MGIYYFYLFLLKNIYCGYSLEPPRRGGSNEYPQSVFWAEYENRSEFLSEHFQFFGSEFFNICFRNGPLFLKGLGAQESKQEVTEVFTLVKTDSQIYQICLVPLRLFLVSFVQNIFACTHLNRIGECQWVIKMYVLEQKKDPLSFEFFLYLNKILSVSRTCYMWQRDSAGDIALFGYVAVRETLQETNCISWASSSEKVSSNIL